MALSTRRKRKKEPRTEMKKKSPLRPTARKLRNFACSHSNFCAIGIYGLGCSTQPFLLYPYTSIPIFLQLAPLKNFQRSIVRLRRFPDLEISFLSSRLFSSLLYADRERLLRKYYERYRTRNQLFDF